MTPALPELPVYSQTSPPSGVWFEIGPVKVALRAAFACASVGHVGVPVVTAGAVVELTAGAAVTIGEVVDDWGFEELVVGLLLLDPQPASTNPTIAIPATTDFRFFTVRNASNSRYRNERGSAIDPQAPFRRTGRTRPGCEIALCSMLRSPNGSPHRLGHAS